MFTGLIQELGTVSATHPDGNGGLHLVVMAPMLAPKATLGDSIAVNGVCLTVVDKSETTMAFQAGPETLARTTVGKLTVHNRVNLEPALRVGDALGGHFVTGHVDTVAPISDIQKNGEWLNVVFAVAKEHDTLLVQKGSIAVDGISLTLVDVAPGLFSVMIIPHTRDHTTLGQRHIGDMVNLEFDPIAKHVKKLFETLTINI